MIAPALLALVGARSYTIDSLALASLLPDSVYVVSRKKTDSVKMRPTMRDTPLHNGPLRSWRISLKVVETDLSQAGKIGIELPTSLGASWSPGRGLAGLTPSALSLVADLAWQRGAASVLASPDVVVQDGQAANLNAEDVHYVEASTVLANGASSTSYQAFSSGLQVSFTPQGVTADSLDLGLSFSYSFPADGRSPPSLSSRSVVTRFRCRVGDTLALAGLRQKRRVRASGLLWWSWEWHEVELALLAVLRPF